MAHIVELNTAGLRVSSIIKRSSEDHGRVQCNRGCNTAKELTSTRDSLAACLSTQTGP